jgi:hypothetical protein
MSNAGEILAQLSPEKRRQVALILREVRRRKATTSPTNAKESGAELVARTRAATAAANPASIPGDSVNLPRQATTNEEGLAFTAGIGVGAVENLAALAAMGVDVTADVLTAGPARRALNGGPATAPLPLTQKVTQGADWLQKRITEAVLGEGVDTEVAGAGGRLVGGFVDVPIGRALGVGADVARTVPPAPRAVAREALQEAPAAASKAPATAPEAPAANAPAVTRAAPGATNTPAPATNVVPFRRSPEEPPAVPADADRDWIAIANDLNQLDLKRRLALGAGDSVKPLPVEEIERLKNLIKRRADREYGALKEAGQPLTREQRNVLYSTGRVQLTAQQEQALQALREFRGKVSAYEGAGITLDDPQLERLKNGQDPKLTAEQARLWSEFDTAKDATQPPKVRREILGRVVRNFPESVEKFGDLGADVARRLREREFQIASRTAKDQQLVQELKKQGLTTAQWDEVVDLLEAKTPPARYRELDPRVVDAATRIENVLAEVDRDAVVAGVLKELPTGEKVLFQGLKNFYPHWKRGDDPEKAALDVLYRRFGTRNRSLTHVRYADDPDYLRGSEVPDVLGSYLRTARVHIEDTKALGPDVQGEIERLGTALTKQGHDGSYARIGLQQAFGTGSRPTRFAREFVGGVNRLQSSLAMGLSPLAQVGQIVSPITKAGFLPVAREAVTLAKAVWSPEARTHIAEIARTGATTGDMLEHMIGEPVNSRFTDVLSKVSLHLRAFAAEDEALRLISAGVGPDYLRDLVGAVRGDAPWWRRIGDFRTRSKIAAQAEDEIRRMGIDVERMKAGSITPDDDARAGFYLSRQTQFSVRPEAAPSLAFTPAGKFFYLFKRYALNQGAFLANEVIAPARQGNLRPLARFLVAGSFVGAGTKTAQDAVLDRENWLLAKIKGEVVARRCCVPDESLGRFVTWSLAASQLGIFYSILTMRPSGFLEFLAGKNLSDVARILDTGRYYAGGAVDAAREGGAPGVKDWASDEFDKARHGEGRINRTVQRVAPIVRQVKEGVFHRDDE